MFAAVALKPGMLYEADYLAHRIFQIFVIGILFTQVYNKLLVRIDILVF